jgi:hypothetical protein
MASRVSVASRSLARSGQELSGLLRRGPLPRRCAAPDPATDPPVLAPAQDHAIWDDPDGASCGAVGGKGGTLTFRIGCFSQIVVKLVAHGPAAKPSLVLLRPVSNSTCAAAVPEWLQRHQQSENDLSYPLEPQGYQRGQHEGYHRRGQDEPRKPLGVPETSAGCLPSWLFPLRWGSKSPAEGHRVACTHHWGALLSQAVTNL